MLGPSAHRQLKPAGEAGATEAGGGSTVAAGCCAVAMGASAGAGGRQTCTAAALSIASLAATCPVGDEGAGAVQTAAAAAAAA